ncbi:MAG: Appr-1-p processing protein, partial [Nodosilinea sp.]
MAWLNLDNLWASKTALMRLVERYDLSGYRTSHLEIQKLAYLLKVAGEPELQGLTYRRSNYGPYAHNLGQALEGTEGDDGWDQGRDRPLDRVSQLIEGFETPYGLEMLAT